MRPRPFALERYFARHEFRARWLLSSSDCEPLAMRELLALADAETLRLWQDLRLAYTDSRGLPLLRREIAALYAGVDADDVLEVVPEEGILLAMMALLDSGDHVVAPRPAYTSLRAVPEAIGCEVGSWQPEETDGGWRFTVRALRAALRPGTRLVILNFPHNPTGALPDRAELEEIVAIARDRGIALFADEMYRDLVHAPGDAIPSVVELDGRALVLGGLSKSYGLPGLRVGWLVTRDPALLARLAELKDYSTICASAPAEILAVMALRARATILERNLGIVRANLATVERFCAEHPSTFVWQRPRAGSVGLARVPGGGARALCDRLAAEASVMLVPSSLFDHGDDHVRFALGRADLAQGLERLSAWLSARDLRS